MLKYIDRLIQLITDPEMYRMIQSNIRSGICHVSVCYARANNKLMGQLHDSNKLSSNEVDVDKINFHGWALSQLLPDGEYEWISDDECREAFAVFQDKAFRDRLFD